MWDCSFKNRVGMFFGMLFIFIPLIVGGGILSLDTLEEYFAFPSELVFTSMFVYGFAGVFILSPVVYCSLWPIVLGRKVPIKVQRYITQYIVAAYIITVACQIGFKCYYSNKLVDKGYVACPGTPRAWMPGMATKYVKEPLLCRE